MIEIVDNPQLFDVSFFDKEIETVVTFTPYHVGSWISEIEFIHRRRLHRLVVGLDIEWRPNTIRGCTSPIATLQLCVGRKSLIFQLIYAPYMPRSLKEFLLNDSYTFVGVGIRKDVEKLEDGYDLSVNNVCELGYLAAHEYGQRSLMNAGLKVLAMEVLGKEVSKPKRVTMSRWDNRWLTDEQVRYACIDAFVCFEIGRFLNAGN